MARPKFDADFVANSAKIAGEVDAEMVSENLVKQGSLERTGWDLVFFMRPRGLCQEMSPHIIQFDPVW